MSEAVSMASEDAQGPRPVKPLQNGEALAARVVALESRVVTLENNGAKLAAIETAVGTHLPGCEPTGLYKVIHDMGHGFESRLSTFEKLRENAKGAIAVALPLLTTLIVVFWYFAEKPVGKALGVD